MMEIENQIAELFLGAQGASKEQMDALIASKFSDATEQQIAAGAMIAIEILEAAAEAYEAEAEPYRAEMAKRGLTP